ncbi:MAG: hypothetical protein IT521_07140 [Burkholderiales bacterium]|nr:hypothetical protein [Burkholderiales bacterium]
MKVAFALLAVFLATLAVDAGAQGDVFSTQGAAGSRPQGDAFNTQGQRGGPCGTNAWIRAHGGRWDRCAYERDCPGPDTRMYGEPDRFPNSDTQRMRGYVRCAVDPCTRNGAQCWGRREDEIRTRGTPSSKPANGSTADGAGDGRKSIKRFYTHPPGGRPADPEMMREAMDRCIRDKGELAYYVSPAVQRGDGLARYDPPSGRIVYNPAALAAQMPYVRAYYLATAFGGHLVALKARQSPRPPSPKEQQQDRDYVVGYLTHCLITGGQLPRATGNDDPRLQFQDFVYASGGKIPLGPAALARGKDFDHGFWDFDMPMLLIPR